MAGPDSENMAIMSQFIRNYQQMNPDGVPESLVQAVAETPGVDLKVRDHGGIEIGGTVVGHVQKVT